MKTILIRLLLALTFLLGGAVLTRAEDLGAVKSRMGQRIGQLDALKRSGAIGENNRGFVEVRDGGGKAAGLVADENRDRETVYAAIARQTGSSPAAVARARARKIASESAPGVWLQEDSGRWYRK